MFDQLALLAVTDTIWMRLGVCAVCIAVGAILIHVGRQNIETQTAEESGKRRLVNKALGRSNTYTGAKAVRIGWARVACGIGAILFGIVFIFVGPFLANDAKASRRAHSSRKSGPPPLRHPRKNALQGPLNDFVRELNDNARSDPFANMPQDRIASVVIADVPMHAYTEILHRLAKLPGVTAASANGNGTSATYRLAPVADLRAVAAAIDFGTVTKIDESQRTLHVNVDESKFPPSSSPAINDAEEFFKRHQLGTGASQ